ncbi:MAG: hypothetical protein WCC90_21890 [Methylocella sp.]
MRLLPGAAFMAQITDGPVKRAILHHARGVLRFQDDRRRHKISAHL